MNILIYNVHVYSNNHCQQESRLYSQRMVASRQPNDTPTITAGNVPINVIPQGTLGTHTKEHDTQCL